MIAGLALIANGAAALSCLIAYWMGAQNIVLITLTAGFGVPLVIVAIMVLKSSLGPAPARVVPTGDDLAARPK